jgi:hypothetical protein
VFCNRSCRDLPSGSFHLTLLSDYLAPEPFVAVASTMIRQPASPSYPATGRSVEPPDPPPRILRVV